MVAASSPAREVANAVEELAAVALLLADQLGVGDQAVAFAEALARVIGEAEVHSVPSSTSSAKPPSADLRIRRPIAPGFIGT